MEDIAPLSLAESWDNVGFLIGNRNRTIHKILIALEITEGVVQEAIADNVDLIITHHPLIFKPLKKLIAEDPISKMVMDLIKHDINLYASHTNLDVAKDGLGSLMADLYPLRNKEALVSAEKSNYFKLVVYVPEANSGEVKEAVVNSGAGKIGNYDSCTFESIGTGSFRPLEGSKPAIGMINEIETVKEVRLEAVINEDVLGQVIKAMIKAHPYEVPAYNVLELVNEIDDAKSGLGVIGYLTEDYTLKQLSEKTKIIFKSQVVKIAGDLDKKMRKIAVVNGCGDEFIDEAVKAGCDVLITGDIKHHIAHDALQKGLSIIDAGHFETEDIYMPMLLDLLNKRFEEKKYEVELVLSKVNTNPFSYIK